MGRKVANRHPQDAFTMHDNGATLTLIDCGKQRTYIHVEIGASTNGAPVRLAAFSGRKTLRALAWKLLDLTGGREAERALMVMTGYLGAAGIDGDLLYRAKRTALSKAEGRSR